MNDTEILVKLENHGNRIDEAEKKIAKLEGNQTQMNDLIVSVQALAIGVKNLTDTSEKMEKKITALESKDAESYRDMKKQIINTTIAVVITAVITFLLASIGG